jgi:hypothetical protein
MRVSAPACDTEQRSQPTGALTPDALAAIGPGFPAASALCSRRASLHSLYRAVGEDNRSKTRGFPSRGILPPRQEEVRSIQDEGISPSSETLELYFRHGVRGPFAHARPASSCETRAIPVRVTKGTTDHEDQAHQQGRIRPPRRPRPNPIAALAQGQGDPRGRHRRPEEGPGRGRRQNRRVRRPTDGHRRPFGRARPFRRKARQRPPLRPRRRPPSRRRPFRSPPKRWRACPPRRRLR